jgi:hypothetical protein
MLRMRFKTLWALTGVANGPAGLVDLAGCPTGSSMPDLLQLDVLISSWQAQLFGNWYMIM